MNNAHKNLCLLKKNKLLDNINKRKKKNKEHNPFYDPTLKKRHLSAKRFKKFTLTSLIFSILFLAFFLFDIVGKGIPAFHVAYIQVDVTFNEKSLNDILFIDDLEPLEVEPIDFDLEPIEFDELY